MNSIIRIEDLSKQYRLGNIGTGTLSRDLNRWWYRMIGREDPYLKIGEKNDRNTKGSSEYVWALKDINLDIKAGEVLGIIGKNGAGKSTLLKILSKVTGPTLGRVSFNGRIGSLLEVGTGFHSELTGKENIFLNGAILGMTKPEIKSKLDEIIDFSGCERYIDTPVKRYSSGMTVRLGFAVAAHLEPEILLIDEVLAVGDAEFQKKCIGKIDEVAKTGRTVLFVSHTMSLINNLCKECILLDDGELIMYDKTDLTVKKYLENSNNASYSKESSNDDLPKIISIDKENNKDDLIFILKINSLQQFTTSIDIRIHDLQGNSVGFGSLGTFSKNELLELKKGINMAKIKIDTSNFAIGSYLISFDIAYPNDRYYDRVENCISFDISRHPKDHQWRVLMQKWNFGSIQIPVSLIDFKSNQKI